MRVGVELKTGNGLVAFASFRFGAEATLNLTVKPRPFT